ncbi:hypothetical protein [Pseudotabrizicola formosa]|uniref:hypothetical protein n=1 Tax=Pseudotabrizicola formosa TaxID=2030009 RepID=UPI001FEEA88E|nr:hypothetical protein [Pseudotabrizicola formosa]
MTTGIKLTLDWNCVIELEERRPQAACVQDLVDRHREGQFEVGLLAASASENSKSKRFPGNATVFMERISALGWQDLPIVPMPAVFGLSYWDFCYFVDDVEKFKRDMDALWQAIAAKVPRKPADHLPPSMMLNDDSVQSEHLWKWRNTWCDVVSAYSHIHAGRDIFVTNNIRDFQKNSDKLSKLGMRKISTPLETLAAVDELSFCNQ